MRGIWAVLGFLMRRTQDKAEEERSAREEDKGAEKREGGEQQH